MNIQWGGNYGKITCPTYISKITIHIRRNIYFLALDSVINTELNSLTCYALITLHSQHNAHLGYMLFRTQHNLITAVMLS